MATVSVNPWYITSEGVSSPIKVVDNLNSTNKLEPLSANMGKVLKESIDSVSIEVQSHLENLANTHTLGHVMVDGTSITIDNNGVISANIESVTIDEIDSSKVMYKIITETEETIEYSETLITKSLIGGYRRPNNGTLVAWPEGPFKTTGSPVDNIGVNKYRINYTLSHNPSPQVLISKYNSSGYDSYDVYSVNEIFEVPSNIINFQVSYALPSEDALFNPFPDLPSLETARIVRLTETIIEGESSYVNIPLTEVISEIKSKLEITPSIPKKTFKFLMIGNSFSENASKYIHNLADNVDINIITANLMAGGATLTDHWNNLNSNSSNYNLQVRKSLNGEVTYTNLTNYKLSDAVIYEDWDVVVYQQSSPYSGQYNTFQPNLNNLINYVNTNKTNPKLKHALHSTWAYSTDYTNASFNMYDNDQLVMYNAICNAYKQALIATNIDILIPSGTAIQNARSLEHLNSIGRELTSDGLHLNSTGEYIASLTLFESLLSKKYKIDIFEDITFGSSADKAKIYFSKLAVKNALLKPFNITQL